MDCHKAKCMLQDLIDERLTQSDRATLLEHLDQCESCTKEWYEWLALRAMLRREESAPIHFDVRRIVDRKRGNPGTKIWATRKWLLSPGYTGLTTTAVLAVLLIVMFAANPRQIGTAQRRALNTDAAISFHAVMRSGGEGVDSAKVHYALVLGSTRDVAEDGTFEVD